MKVDNQSAFNSELIIENKQHKNIIKLLSHHQTADYLIISYPLMKEDLSEVLKKSVLLDESYVQKITKGIVEGLSYLHSKNIIHRDIKPMNIMLDKCGEVTIIDFGVAVRYYKLLPSSRMGTGRYMAPEVHNKQKYDCRADIWSLGITVYELLGGKSHQQTGFSTNQILEDPIWCLYPIAKQFIESILVPMENRPTAKELLDHIWLKGTR